MTPRERLLALVLVSFLSIGGLAALVLWVYLPMVNERHASIARLEKETQEKQERIFQIAKDKVRLDRYRMLSLPPDIDMDRQEYQKYLAEIFRESGFESGTFRIVAESPDSNMGKVQGKKDAVYIALPFTIQAHGNLTELVEALETFYKTGLLHRIKTLSIQRPITTNQQERQNGDLTIDIKIEALVVAGTEQLHRHYLLPNIDPRLVAIDMATSLQHGVPGLAFVPWMLSSAGPHGPDHLAQPKRDYSVIAKNNIFLGPPPPVVVSDDVREEPSKYVYLTGLTKTGGRTFIDIYDRMSDRKITLRGSRGSDTFQILPDNDRRTVLQAAVLKIEDREVIYRVQVYGKDSENSRDDRNGFFHPGDEVWASIQKNSNLTDADRDFVFLIDREYWNTLVDKGVVSFGEDSENRFSFDSTTRVKLLKGRVLPSENREVVIKVDRKYCAFHIGTNLLESLLAPLSTAKLEDLGVLPTPEKVTKDP